MIYFYILIILYKKCLDMIDKTVVKLQRNLGYIYTSTTDSPEFVAFI